MKKLFILLTLVCVSMIAVSQTVVVESASLTVLGTGTNEYVIPSNINQGLDYSYQVVPTLAGSGDSLNVAIALWQSNSFPGTVYTELTAARDTATAATGNLIEGANAKGIKHKIILTGISTDTITVKVYVVLKDIR